MNNPQPINPRILAITTSNRGIGFAVLEGRDTLVNWGGGVSSGANNRKSLAKVEQLIFHYQPEVLVLENESAKDSRRGPRIRKLSEGIIALAARRKVQVKLFSRSSLKNIFIADGEGTRHDIATIVAERFSQEIGFRLPPKRRPWITEARRMDFFNAVALTVAHRLWESNRIACPIGNSGH
jgi:hypothetical protein